MRGDEEEGRVGVGWRRRREPRGGVEEEGTKGWGGGGGNQGVGWRRREPRGGVEEGGETTHTLVTSTPWFPPPPPYPLAPHL